MKMKEPIEKLIGKHCKAVWHDNNQDKVLKGIFQSHDLHTITILADKRFNEVDRPNEIIIIGKSVLVSLKEDYQNRGE